jgi:hypothetical protein
MFGSLPTTVRTPLRRPTSRRGVVNLVELAAAEMIDWLLGAGGIVNLFGSTSEGDHPVPG